jgi:hypothetical protein
VKPTCTPDGKWVIYTIGGWQSLEPSCEWDGEADFAFHRRTDIRLQPQSGWPTANCSRPSGAGYCADSAEIVPARLRAACRICKHIAERAAVAPQSGGVRKSKLD